MSDINTLRTALFETLVALKDKTAPMDLDRARAICDVSQTIINSAKVEVDYMKATGANIASAFIAAPEPQNSKPSAARPGYRLVGTAPGGANPSTPAVPATAPLVGRI